MIYVYVFMRIRPSLPELLTGYYYVLYFSSQTMKCQLSLFKCHRACIRLLQFNYGEEKKEFYRFAIKSKTRIHIRVWSMVTPRGHVARTVVIHALHVVHFDSFLITFVIKNTEKKPSGRQYEIAPVRSN